ncbi:MAG: heat-inducible transcriptional repressor HrcA [Caldicoprobacterales bacterium]|nr:heat-inducible transcription repressor HrcA [Clostridiales bacterium]
MKLDSRKLQILQAIINDYIITAEPVGSRTVARKYNLGISSATIRNEMSDLEEMGFLEQPHTSAGRVPSDKAYRLYVDRLMRIRELTDQEAEYVKRTYQEKIMQLEQVIFQTAKVLSDITDYTSIALAPQLNKVTIRHIQLVPVDKDFALLVVVTSSGILKDTLIRIPEGIDSDFLQKVSNILNDHFQGRTFDQIDIKDIAPIREVFARNQKFFNSLVDILTGRLRESQQKEVYLGGTTNIFNFPEYQDILRARSFLNLMEEKDLLYHILSRSNDGGVKVTIGTENPHEELKECSIVTATYSLGDRVLGTIGIIGPTRMEYSKAVSVMDYMGKALSTYLTRLFGE